MPNRLCARLLPRAVFCCAGLLSATALADTTNRPAGALPAADRLGHWIAQARAAEQAGDTALARALLEPALTAPRTAPALRASLHLMRARLFLVENAPVSARLDAEQALTIDPTNGGALSLLARLVRAGGGADAAAESARLTLKAARQGVIEAQREAGELLLAGIGLDANLRKARYWLTRAASAGDSAAMRSLARSYADAATPTDRDPALAASWLARADIATNSSSMARTSALGGAAGGLDNAAEQNDR